MTFQQAVDIVDARAMALAEDRESIRVDDLRLLFAGTDVQAVPAIEWLRQQLRVVAPDPQEAERIEDGVTAFGVVALLVGVELGKAAR